MSYRRRFVPLASAIIILSTVWGILPSAFAQSPRASDTTTIRRASTQKALAWLHTQQEEDGRFGRSFTVQDAAATAEAVLSIALAGENPGGEPWSRGGRSAQAALADLAPGYVGTDAGKAGKIALAVAAAKDDPRSFGGVDYVAIILDAHDPATGLYHPGILFRHLLAVQGLVAAGMPVPPAAIDAILRAQSNDGGWGWIVPVTRTLSADVDTTGRALTSLVKAGVPVTSTAILSATAYLASQQRADGGWAGQGSAGKTNSNSTALAWQGLLAAGQDPQNTPWQRGSADPLTVLLSLQGPDGAFVYSATQTESRLLATLDALQALSLPFPKPANTIDLGDGYYHYHPRIRRYNRWLAI